MNEMLSFALSLFLASVIPGLICLLLSLLLPRKRFARFHRGERYSFLRDFPFELYEGEKRESILPKVFLFGFAGFFLLLACYPLFLQGIPDFSFLLPIFLFLGFLRRKILLWDSAFRKRPKPS